MVGATVIATTRTGAKRQALIDAGAHHVVATEEEDLVEGDEDNRWSRCAVVLDPVGGPSFEPLTESMARGGILLQYGALSGEPTPFPLFSVLGKSLTLKGYLYSEIVSDDAALDRAKAFIVAGLESGALKPRIARTFPLDAIQDAHRFLESNDQIGKVVVTGLTGIAALTQRTRTSNQFNSTKVSQHEVSRRCCLRGRQASKSSKSMSPHRKKAKSSYG